MVWSTTLVTAVAMIAMIGTVLLVLSGLSNSRVATVLNDRLDAVSATLVLDKAGDLNELRTADDDTIDNNSWVFDTGGRQIAGPTAGKHVQATVESLSRVSARKTFEKRARVYLAVPISDEKTGKPLAVVVVAESLEPYEATRTAILIGLIALGVAVIGGTAAIAAWTVGRTLDPVNAMATSADDWSEHDLESRFEPGSADNEIAHLGRTLNLLLDRVATTIRGEQLLTSELAHELRTPLTAIRGEVELAIMKSNDAGTRERLDRVVELVDRMSTTITTLVSLARGHSAIGQRCNISSALASVVGDLQVRGSVTVDTVGIDDSLEAATTAEMLERVLAPILDNAIRYAATAVTITATDVGRMVTIDVSDDGPGVALDDLDDVFRAGARSRGSEGAGLGLALSLRVASTIGGDIQLSSVANPTTFTVTVPSY